MNIPSDLKYTKSHEWVRLEDDGSVTIGITDHAQDALGDMVFVENPEVGRKLKRDEECAVVESVKAASDVYAPIAGTVIANNAEVEGAPQRINEAPYQAWMFKLKPNSVADLESLLTASDYQKLLESEKH